MRGGFNYDGDERDRLLEQAEALGVADIAVSDPAAAEAPLSAIDWLSDSIATPLPPPASGLSSGASAAIPDRLPPPSIGSASADASSSGRSPYSCST